MAVAYGLGAVFANANPFHGQYLCHMIAPAGRGMLRPIISPKRPEALPKLSGAAGSHSRTAFTITIATVDGIEAAC